MDSPSGATGNVKEKTEPWPRWLVRLIDAAVSRDNCFGNRQAHAGALHHKSLVFATIKFLENKALFEVVNSSAAIGHAGNYEIAAHFGGNCNGLVRRENIDLRFRLNVKALLSPNRGQLERAEDRVRRPLAQHDCRVWTCIGSSAAFDYFVDWTRAPA